MESGIQSRSAATYVVCNLHLRTCGQLLGLNTIKDLHLCDRHATDRVEDPDGRPFRKYSHNQLDQLEVSVSAYNRRRRLTIPHGDKPRRTIVSRSPDTPVVTVRMSSTQGPAKSRVNSAKVLSRGPIKPRIPVVSKRLFDAEDHDDRRVFAHLTRTCVQEIPWVLSPMSEDPQRALPNFYFYLRAKWREDKPFEHKWKTLWNKRLRGLRRKS